jgi:hypothetical protein
MYQNIELIEPPFEHGQEMNFPSFYLLETWIRPEPR